MARLAEGLVRGKDGVVRCAWGASHPDYARYHDEEWGFPVADDRRLFEKLCLEGFQSGLSWLTILRKRGSFRADLFFRLRMVAVHLPPLRERGDDVLQLAERFLVEQRKRYGKPRLYLTDAARAVLRRPGDRSDTVLRLGPLALDTAARSVTVNETPIVLARRELGVLEHLMRTAGRVASRQVLEEAIYTLDDEVTPNALEAAVSRLRRALEAAGCPVPIVNVRGVGWMLPREAGQ